jgi:hypothetical protein
VTIQQQGVDAKNGKIYVMLSPTAGWSWAPKKRVFGFNGQAKKNKKA